MTWKMPAEWERHERTWLSFPSSEYSTPIDDSYRAWSAVANMASEFEPVTVLIDPAQEQIAKKYLSSEISKLVCDLNDSWIRDNGATFVVNSVNGKLGAIDWRFNGWGSLAFDDYKKDDLVASFMADHVQAEIIRSELVNEGGGIHVNGNGVLMVTETVQLGQERNPDWTKSEVEQELKLRLGVEEIVWIRRGLARDYEAYGTKGHIDIVACFANHQTILMHDQQDQNHPDFTVSHEVSARLAELKEMTVIKVPAPKVLKDSHGFVDYSYINHYVLNGAVLLCAFDDENDAEAKAILTEAYPGREVKLIDARPIFAKGGGIHCITQQQPAV